MALDALGLGIGMTGAPKEYTNLISQAVATKQRDDLQNESLYQGYMKNITLDDTKYHRLVRPEADEITKDFTEKLTRLKIENPRGWMNQVPSLFQSYKSKMTDLSTLSDQYFTFEKAYSNPSLKLYRTREIDEIAKSIKTGTDYRRLPADLSAKGITSNDIVAFDERGSLFFVPMQAFDFAKDAQNFRRVAARQHSAILSTNSKYREERKTESIFTTNAELDNFARENNLSATDIANVPTLESNFTRLMMDPAAERQLVDLYTRNNPDKPATDKDLFDFYVTMVKPYVGTTFSDVIKSNPQDRTVNVNVDNTPEGLRLSNWVPSTIGGKQAKAVYLPDGKFKIGTSLEKQTIDGTLDENLNPVEDLSGIKETIINEKGADGTIVGIVRYKNKNYAQILFPKPISGKTAYYFPVQSVGLVLGAGFSKQDEAKLNALLADRDFTEAPSGGGSSTGFAPRGQK